MVRKQRQDMDCQKLQFRVPFAPRFPLRHGRIQCILLNVKISLEACPVSSNSVRNIFLRLALRASEGFMAAPRVMLADDHTILVEAFRKLLEPQYDVVGTVAYGRALV